MTCTPPLIIIFSIFNNCFSFAITKSILVHNVTLINAYQLNIRNNPMVTATKEIMVTHLKIPLEYFAFHF